jgi:hypothetical protein
MDEIDQRLEGALSALTKSELGRLIADQLWKFHSWYRRGREI